LATHFRSVKAASRAKASQALPAMRGHIAPQTRSIRLDMKKNLPIFGKLYAARQSFWKTLRRVATRAMAAGDHRRRL
jgi:hypothetical protein